MPTEMAELQGGDICKTSVEHKVCDLDPKEARIEYDDAAILAFHPHLRRRLDFDNTVEEDDHHDEQNDTCKYTPEDGTCKMDGSLPEQQTLIPANIANIMLQEIHNKIANLKEGIAQSRQDVKAIKSDFEKMNSNLDILDRRYGVVQRLARRYHGNLDVVIHQNTIIRHLEHAARQMQLLECYVTEDHHVIFAEHGDSEQVLVQECSASAHNGSDNNSCCTCQYKTKFEIYDDVD